MKMLNSVNSNRNDSFAIAISAAQRKAGNAEKVMYPFIADRIFSFGKAVLASSNPLAKAIVDERNAAMVEAVLNLREGKDILPDLWARENALTSAVNAWYAAHPSQNGTVQQYRSVRYDAYAGGLIGEDLNKLLGAITEEEAQKILGKYDLSEVGTEELAVLTGLNFWPDWDNKRAYVLQEGIETVERFTATAFKKPTWLEEEDARNVLADQFLALVNGNDSIMEMAVGVFNRQCEIWQENKTAAKKEENQRVYTEDFSSYIVWLQTKYQPGDAELKYNVNATVNALHTVQQLVDLLVNYDEYERLYFRTPRGELALMAERQTYRWLFANGLVGQVFQTIGAEPESVADWREVLQKSLDIDLADFTTEEQEAWCLWATTMLKRIEKISEAHWWELKVVTTSEKGTITSYKGGVAIPETAEKDDPVATGEFIFTELIRKGKTNSDISKNSNNFCKEIAAQLLEGNASQE